MLATECYGEDTKRELSQVRCACGFTIEDVLRSGSKNPDSSIGAYAGDALCYQTFAPFFDQVIERYHDYGVEEAHKHNLDITSLAELKDLNEKGKQVVSTRIRVARNLADYSFAPAISQTARLEIESKIANTLTELKGDLAGEYYPLSRMDEKTRSRLVSDHFLFKAGDRFLDAAGCNRDWPEGRGIFHSADKKFLVWINEEDSLRIISMDKGGDLVAIFERLSRAIQTIQQKLDFAYSDHLGYLSSCPTNLGTAMRASVHVSLPRVEREEDLKRVCKDLRLSVRGIHGEHSESEGAVFDISNKQRLGISEVECVKLLHSGTAQLIEMFAD